MTQKPTTGKYSVKDYKCLTCGNIEKHGTNHWGKIYNLKCKACGWKNPLELQSFKCIEPCPDTHGVPTEWQTVKLGDIVEIT